MGRTSRPVQADAREDRSGRPTTTRMAQHVRDNEFVVVALAPHPVTSHHHLPRRAAGAGSSLPWQRGLWPSNGPTVDGVAPRSPDVRTLLQSPPPALS